MDVPQRTRSPVRTPSAPTAATFRSRLDELTAQYERLKRLVAICEASSDATPAKPVSDRIYDLLRGNRDMSFSPAEIMECIHARENHIEAVRKALQRLCDRGMIVRIGHASYRINLAPSEDPTP